MKVILCLWFVFALAACSEQEPPESSSAYVYTSKAKDSPKVQAMLSGFYGQEHRIELKGCEFEYNGTPFKLGMKISELNQVLGHYDFFYRRHYVWESLGIAVLVDKADYEENVNSDSLIFAIYMEVLSDDEKKNERLKHLSFPKMDYFLLEGMPLNREVQFRDVIAGSLFKLDDFLVSNDGYEIDYLCEDSKETLNYTIYVDGGWIYSGSGHINLKSHHNQNNINTIETVYIERVRGE